LKQTDIEFDDALLEAMKDDLEKVIMKEVCESVQVGKEPDHVSQKEIALECNRRKNSVMELLSTSVRTQRLYFVLRSIFMGLISALITFAVILYLESINFAQAIFLGIFVFTFSLMFSRLFDNQIVSVSLKIIRFLEKHNRLRSVILRTF
jgi:hypothetical protein